MKKLYFILLASLLVLGMAQCKKETHEMVPIKLSVVGNEQKVSNEQKGLIAALYNDPTASFYYEEGDLIYVGSMGKYVGSLSCQNFGLDADGNGVYFFTGSIDASAVEEGQPLQFIYMGGQDVTESLELGSTTQYTFSLAHQHSQPAVVSCGTSVENYTGSGSYSTYMINQCALVRFTMNTHTKQVVTISGVKNELKVNFDGTVQTTTTTGDIETSLHFEIGSFSDYSWDVRYAVVPADQGIVENGTVSAPNYTGTFTIPSAAYVNAYIKDGTMTLTQTGSAPFGEYSVDWDRRVTFSPGNLQATWDDSDQSWSWKFADHQWDYVGNDEANTSITGDGQISGTGTVDLFGWSSPSTYFGINPSTDSNEDDNDYAGDFLDWGLNTIYNPLTGQNDVGGIWRTLTRDEWAFLLYQRIEWGTQLSSSPYYVDGGYKSFLLGTITTGSGATHKGLIIFPDYYTGEGLKGTYNFNNKPRIWNTVSAEDWQTMENDGAVFLPIAGVRSGVNVQYTSSVGAYSSATPSGIYQRNNINFSFSEPYCQMNPADYYDPSGNPSYGNYQPRYYGLSVRLVTGGVEPAPPTVITKEVTNIVETTALGGGLVTSSGGVALQTCGICWSTSHNPDLTNNHTTDSPVFDFNSFMDGLTPNTTYYVRAYVTNSAGLTGYGNEVSFTTHSGTRNGYFSVSRTKQVIFSPGNLQYDDDEIGWRFAEHQYDYIGNRVEGELIDLFSFDVWNSSWNIDPYTITNSPYESFPGNFSIGMSLNGNDWFTLSMTEWLYVVNPNNDFDRRHVIVGNEAKVPFGLAKVMGHNGLILLPDNWNGLIDPNFTYGLSSSFESNVYTESTTVTWQEMEAAGVAFLPAAGIYNPSLFYYNHPMFEAGSYGGYWSASAGKGNEYEGSWLAYMLTFPRIDDEPIFENNYGIQRPETCASVRLVRDIQPEEWKGGK